MPLSKLIILLAAVILAAGATIWFIDLGRPELVVWLLPVLMSAGLLVRFLRR